MMHMALYVGCQLILVTTTPVSLKFPACCIHIIIVKLERMYSLSKMSVNRVRSGDPNIKGQVYSLTKK